MSFVKDTHTDSDAPSHVRRGKRMDEETQERTVLGEVTNKQSRNARTKGKQAASRTSRTHTRSRQERSVSVVVDSGMELETASSSSSSSAAKDELASSTSFGSDVDVDVDLDLDEMTTTTAVAATTDSMDAYSVEFDVDKDDQYDPQQAGQYAEDIYAYLHDNAQRFRPNEEYMGTVQTDINRNMRSILMDWLVEVAEEYRLVSDSLFLAVNYIDRYLSIESVSRSKLQLVGITGMFIASKYEEVYAPSVEDFVYISDYTYNRNEVLNLEAKMIEALEFNLTCATSKVFLRRLLKVADADARTRLLASFLTELTLVDYDYLVYEPALIASCAVYLALLTREKTPWSRKLQFHAKFDEEQMRPCLNQMLDTFRASRTSNLQAVREKYSQPRLGNVANMPVPDAIPEENFVDAM